MPWYFFEMRDGYGSTYDRCGVECADENAARAQAVRSLCELVHYAALRGVPDGASATVRDSQGRFVLHVRLALSSEWEPEIAERSPEVRT